MYITDNWRAFRTWGISARNAWGYSVFWELRDGVKRERHNFKVDWDTLQKPGLSPDYHPSRQRCHLRHGLRAQRLDPHRGRQGPVPQQHAAAGLHRRQAGALHHQGAQLPAGQTVEKQAILINDSRATVDCDCSWSLGLPQAIRGSKKVTIQTGQQERIPLSFALPADLKPGTYQISLTAKFSTGETQEDTFAINVLAPKESPKLTAKTALFDPKGETAKLLTQLGVRYEPVAADADLAGYDVLIVGKAALTVDGPAPDISEGPRRPESRPVRADRRRSGEAVRLPRAGVRPAATLPARARPSPAWRVSGPRTCTTGAARRPSCRRG